MNIFKRLFSIGSAEANSALDKLEDPIKMTEQGIREMKADLDKSLHGLAEVKALAIRAKNDLETNTARANDYESKAMLLLQKAEAGGLDPVEADRLATEALGKKTEHEGYAAQNKKDRDTLEVKVSQLETAIKSLRNNVNKWENELKTLKARVKVSNATKNLNKQLANIDSSSTVGMLERMKEKVTQDEALSDSYAEIADSNKSTDDEIDKALGTSTTAAASSSLAALKAKMAANKGV